MVSRSLPWPVVEVAEGWDFNAFATVLRARVAARRDALAAGAPAQPGAEVTRATDLSAVLASFELTTAAVVVFPAGSPLHCEVTELDLAALSEPEEASLVAAADATWVLERTGPRLALIIL